MTATVTFCSEKYSKLNQATRLMDFHLFLVFVLHYLGHQRPKKHIRLEIGSKNIQSARLNLFT